MIVIKHGGFLFESVKQVNFSLVETSRDYQRQIGGRRVECRLLAAQRLDGYITRSIRQR